MFSTLIQKVKNLFLNHNDHYSKFQKSLSESQPIAFMVTASLLIATFLGNGTIGQQYTLVASLAFFLAYIGFHLYNFTEDYPYFYWAACLVITGFILLYTSFADVYAMINLDDNPLVKTLAFITICSLLYVMTWSSLTNCENKNTTRYKVSKKLLWISLLISIFLVPISYISDLNDIFFYLLAFGIVLSFPLGFASFFIALTLDDNLKNSKENKRMRL